MRFLTKGLSMKIDPFNEHPKNASDQKNPSSKMISSSKVVAIIDEAIVLNFERREDAASYVAVDNTLKFLKHKLEDLLDE
mgnify:CR=1 FL=1